MRRPTMRVLVASLLVVASMTATTAQSPPPEEPATRTVEISGAGATVALPREWRTWASELLDGRPAVGTTDVASGWTCQITSSDEAATAEAAGDAFVEGAEYMPHEVSVTGPLEVPTGNAVGVTFGSPERDPPNRIQHLVFVDAPQSLVRIYCGSAPIDHGLDVARTIAPLAADYSPPPFDPRVELAEHGFAVDFGVEWRVSSRTEHLTRSLLGRTTVLRAQTAAIDGDGPPADTCTIEDATGVPGLAGRTSAADWKAAFVDAAKGPRGRKLTTAVVDLPSGPAIRVDWKRLWRTAPATAWVVSDDDRVVVLVCLSKRPPEDRWRSIAETIEFLPAEE